MARLATYAHTPREVRAAESLQARADIVDVMDVHVAPLTTSDAAVLGPEHNRIWRATYTGLLPASRLDGLDDEHLSTSAEI